MMYMLPCSPRGLPTIHSTGGTNTTTTTQVNNSIPPCIANTTTPSYNPTIVSSHGGDLLAELMSDTVFNPHLEHESSREGGSGTSFMAASVLANNSSNGDGAVNLCQELKNRWEKATPYSSSIQTGSVGGHLTSVSSYGFNFRGMAVTPTSGTPLLRHDDISKVTGGGIQSRTRWEASYHNRRTASDAGLNETAPSGTIQLAEDDDGSGSSAPGSFQHEGGLLGRKRRCLVCEDSASGYHYGVSSCEACKAFFKRTIQGNIEYACPASNSCTVDRKNRKACQACRYKKCISVGMLKEGVRLDRVRGGRQKYRRANNGEPIMVQTPLSQQHQQQQLQQQQQSFITRRTTANTVELTHLIAALLACEPPAGSASVTDRLDTPLKLQSVLCDLADRDLVGIIGWAKQIPGFPEILLSDQMHLLQSTWCEILLFSLCVRSIETSQRGVLLFTQDFPVDEAMAREAGFGAVHGKACRLVDALKVYRIVKEEYVLIKCIILLNGGCVLENTRARDALRDTLVQSLHQFVDGVPRSSNLLLLLPHLKHLDGLAKDYWYMIKNGGQIAMHKLFMEMLESAHLLT